MTVATAQISESLQMLIDSRLDTIDRMLLERLSRQERLAIVTEVESQIHELLHANDAYELTREDVLAVLARLDPPEAYLAEEAGTAIGAARQTTASRLSSSTPDGDRKAGRVSGILGLVALTLVLIFPLALVAAELAQSVGISLILLGGMAAATFIVSILGLVLGILKRKSGTWAIVGVVLTAISFPFSLAEIVFLVLLIWSVL